MQVIKIRKPPEDKWIRVAKKSDNESVSELWLSFVKELCVIRDIAPRIDDDNNICGIELHIYISKIGEGEVSEEEEFQIISDFGMEGAVRGGVH